MARAPRPLFLDATTNGNDVYVVTRDRFLGWDIDDRYDLYDARVGGWLPRAADASTELHR